MIPKHPDHAARCFEASRLRMRWFRLSSPVRVAEHAQLWLQQSLQGSRVAWSTETWADQNLQTTECKESKQCAPAKHHYDECVERVTSQEEKEGGAKEDCVEECKSENGPEEACYAKS